MNNIFRNINNIFNRMFGNYTQWDISDSDPEQNFDDDDEEEQEQEQEQEQEKEQIDFSSLPTIILNEDEVDETKNCPICFEDFSKGNEVYLFACYHYFHKKCIRQWLIKKKECPVCREKKLFIKNEGLRKRFDKMEKIKKSRQHLIQTNKLRNIKTKYLVRRLHDIGIDTSHVLEKQELIDLLIENDCNLGVRVGPKK